MPKISALPTVTSMTAATTVPVVQAGVTSKVTFTDFTEQLTQTATNFIFPQDGALVQRLNDRVVIGGATASDLLFPNVVQDWFTIFQIAAGPATSGTVLSTQAAVMTSTSSSANVGFLSASRSLHFTSAGSACIGAMFAAVNNNATLATKAWGVYIEAHRTAASPQDTYGIEVDTRTTTDSIVPHPWQLGEVVGMQLASGAEATGVGQFDASCAIQIAANPMQFKKGINFMNDALDGSSGGVGEACAIAMAISQNVEWFNSSGVRTAYVKATTTNAANTTAIIMNDSGLFVVGAAGQACAAVVNVNSAVNYLQLSASTATNPVRLIAAGTDTNIDVQLEPKGTGLPRFGGFTGSADAPVNGYVTIKDSGGTTRKLATIA